MSVVEESQFQLCSILRCSAAGPADTAPNTASPLPSTQVLLDVGGSSSGRASAAVPVRYRCPAYLIQRGSATLRDVMADALDNDPAPTTTADAAPTVLPLPFVEAPIFEAVAIYLEHFYGLSSFTAANTGGDAADDPRRLSTSGEVVTAARVPSVLRRPCQLGDLYALSPWEHHYVLHCLLGVPWSQITKLDVAAEGRWVDVVSGSGECFALQERQRMWTRLTAVLEAATRLGVSSLQLLGATVAANMTMDLDAGGLAQLMGGEEAASSAAGQRVVPPFTAEARARLLQRFPWLSQGRKEAQPTRQ